MIQQRSTSPYQPQAGWQVTLADLSLILFLAALSGLGSRPQPGGADTLNPQHAPSQALYRWESDAPGFREWLVEQDLDDRSSLTVVVQYKRGEEAWAISRLSEMLGQQGNAQIATRAVLKEGSGAEAYATLGYDAEQLASASRQRPER